MYNVRSRRSFAGGAGLLALLLFAAAAPSSAQDRQTRYAVERAQVGVSGKIIQERGGGWQSVTFDQTRTQTWRVSDRQTGVRGAGRHAPGDATPDRPFTYEAVVDHRNGKIESVSYDMAGGRPGGGGGRDDSRAPRWLVGTFYGRSPSASNRSRRVTLTVTRDGDATAVYDNGAREQGTYDNGRIRFNASDSWDVSRVDGGIRAASGRRSEVLTLNGSGSGYGNNNDDDDGGRVPRWMRGTFRGTTDTGESELTIRADGTATARALTKNQSFRGTYSEGRLRFDWGTYEVERTSDGIRTVDVNNRNSTEYRRTAN
ncbi:MAG TPA: hypothetical protein VGB98_08915 [Pyrinomonadaceae bacterium]|jgi:hypothetical protein